MFFNTLLRPDPGPCPVDGAPHTTCVPADNPPLVDVQTPGRDALVASRAAAAAAEAALQPGEFTTKTYRRAGRSR
jgi:hypothetical protein